MEMVCKKFFNRADPATGYIPIFTQSYYTNKKSRGKPEDHSV